MRGLVVLIALLAAVVAAAEGQLPARDRGAHSVTGNMQPGDVLRLHTLPGGRGIQFELLAAGDGLGCRAEVPDLPARAWFEFGESNGWTRSVTRQLGPDRAKAAGVALWRLARCYTPPSPDRACSNMPDWTGAEIRAWSAELLRRHPGLGWVGQPLLDGLTDAEVEDLYDRARAFARGCTGLADEK